METFASSTERGRRARWWRIALWSLAIALAIVSAAMALGWRAFHQLHGDLAGSNARLPARMGSMLSGAAPSTGSGTFLIAAPQGGIAGAVLIRVDPSTGTATTVELGSREQVGANRVGKLTTRGDVTALIGALWQEGVPVNHVLLVEPGEVGTVIDALGGVAVTNPTAVTLLDPSGRSFSLDAGQIRLRGPLTDAYLYGQEQDNSTASPEQRQLNGLAAIGAAVLEPLSLTLRSPNRLGGVIGNSAATDLTATTYLDELHAWGEVGQSVSCSAVDRPADATSVLALLAVRGAGSTVPARCSTASVRPSGWNGRLDLLGSDPGGMLALAAALALLGSAICLLVLELSSPGFRMLRDRRRWAGAEAGPPQRAEPTLSPPPDGRRRLGLPKPLLRRGQPARRLHRWRFDTGKARIGLRARWRRRRTAAVFSGGFLVGNRRFRRHPHLVGERGNLAGYAAVLAVAVGSGFVIAQLLTR